MLKKLIILLFPFLLFNVFYVFADFTQVGVNPYNAYDISGNYVYSSTGTTYNISRGTNYMGVTYDFNGDGNKEIVIHDGNYLRIISNTGVELNNKNLGFPQQSALYLYQLNSGNPELFEIANNSFRGYTISSGLGITTALSIKLSGQFTGSGFKCSDDIYAGEKTCVYVNYNATANRNYINVLRDLGGSPNNDMTEVIANCSTGGSWYTTTNDDTIADVDGDGSQEVIWISHSVSAIFCINVWNIESKSYLESFSDDGKKAHTTIHALTEQTTDVLVYNFDGVGDSDLVYGFGVYIIPNTEYTYYFLNGDGSTLWSYATGSSSGGSSHSNPALYDIPSSSVYKGVGFFSYDNTFPSKNRFKIFDYQGNLVSNISGKDMSGTVYSVDLNGDGNDDTFSCGGYATSYQGIELFNYTSRQPCLLDDMNGDGMVDEVSFSTTHTFITYFEGTSSGEETCYGYATELSCYAQDKFNYSSAICNNGWSGNNLFPTNQVLNIPKDTTIQFNNMLCNNNATYSPFFSLKTNFNGYGVFNVLMQSYETGSAIAGIQFVDNELYAINGAGQTLISSTIQNLTWYNISFIFNDDGTGYRIALNGIDSGFSLTTAQPLQLLGLHYGGFEFSNTYTSDWTLDNVNVVSGGGTGNNPPVINSVTSSTNSNIIQKGSNVYYLFIATDTELNDIYGAVKCTATSPISFFAKNTYSTSHAMCYYDTVGCIQAKVIVTDNQTTRKVGYDNPETFPFKTLNISVIYFCGDGVCNPTESFVSCSVDCVKSTCGDSTCQPTETISSCPVDCLTATCGNADCETKEDYVSCPADCNITTCGDGICECSPLETDITCPKDCLSFGGNICNDGVCSYLESYLSCPTDCPLITCQNLICDSGETYLTCPHDCAVCGNAICEISENRTASCLQDCSPANAEIPAEIVNPDNIEEGLLPEIYMGIRGFFSPIIIPLIYVLGAIAIVMTLMALFGLAFKKLS